MLVFFVYWSVTGLVYILAWAASRYTGCDVLPVALVLEHGKARAAASHPHPHPHPNPNLEPEPNPDPDPHPHPNPNPNPNPNQTGRCFTSNLLSAAFSILLCLGGSVNACAGFYADAALDYSPYYSPYYSPTGRLLRQRRATGRRPRHAAAEVLAELAAPAGAWPAGTGAARQ